MPRLLQLTCRRPALAAAALVLVALLAGALALKPFATSRLRDRLAKQVGPVESLRIDGSPLALLAGAPTAVAVRFTEATTDGEGTDRLHDIDRVDLAAATLHTRRLTIRDVRVTKRGDRLRLTATVPPQTVRLAGRELSVTPVATDGTLRLDVAGLPLPGGLAVSAEDGRIRAAVADGPLAGRPLPLGGDADGGRRIDRMAAVETDGRVRLTVDATEAA